MKYSYENIRDSSLPFGFIVDHFGHNLDVQRRICVDDSKWHLDIQTFMDPIEVDASIALGIIRVKKAEIFAPHVGFTPRALLA